MGEGKPCLVLHAGLSGGLREGGLNEMELLLPLPNMAKHGEL